ncbi:RNase H domain-containing protein [Trichonephila clavipes]|nr:RNase H domain-containing protein [Trichonephila clavipes]
MLQSAKNYRPISLTSTLCKLMERVIHRRLMNWLIENKKLHFYQTAFRTHHSTTDQLFYLNQSIIDGFQESLTKKTLAVFLDISAAFDRVWRQKLVHLIKAPELSHVPKRPCNSQTKRTGNDSNTLKITLQSPTPMVPQTDPSAMEVPELSYSSQMNSCTTKRKSCILQWITAHVNIEGNECADSLAKEARDIEHKCTTITLDDANAVAKHRIMNHTFKKPLVTEFDCPRIITSTIARLRTEHLKVMKIHPDKTRSYVQCKHCPDLQLTPNHILECPTVATKLLKMGMVPLRDSLRELLYSLMLPE